MTSVDISDRFAEMWRTSREDAGRSQEYMAKALGVSKKTIQNWEAGTSCPNQLTGFAWFNALGLQPLPYYLKLLFPDDCNGESCEDLLIDIIHALPEGYKKKLLYILHGGHGSSPICILDMVTAHLQSPLRGRLNVAQSISMNYDLAAATDSIRCPEDIQPDTEQLHNAINAAYSAILSGNDDYNSII